jgi:hypothetical protein
MTEMKIFGIIQLSAVCYMMVNLLFAPVVFADGHPIKNYIGPHTLCRFESEYHRIKFDKTDPRVAYIDITPLMKMGGDFSFRELCLDISQQTEDSHVIFDRHRGFFQIFFEDLTTTDAIAYFAGHNKSPGVMLYVTRYLDYWRTGVFAYRNNKWKNFTNEYLGRFHLSKDDYIIVPQYGRTARVLSYDGVHFHHKLWLTWDGTKFTASTARKMPGWHCPDAYLDFDPPARREYCR